MVGLVWSGILASWTDWSSRAESYSIVVILGASLFSAVVLKRRRIGRLTTWDLVLPLLFLSGTLRDVYLEGISPAHGVLPLLLLMLQGHALLIRNPWARVGAVSISTFLLQFTGFGLFCGAVTILLYAAEVTSAWLASDRTKLAASILGVLAAAGTIGCFVFVSRFQPAVECFRFPHERPWEYPMFSALMVANFAFLKWRVLGWAALGAGALVLASLLLACVASWRGSRKEDGAVEAYLLTFTLLFVLTVPIRRICLGLEAAQMSRYMPLLIPGFFGLYLWISAQGQARWRNAALVAFVLFSLPGAVYPWKLGDDYPNAEKFRLREQWRQCYVATDSIRDCDAQTGISVFPVTDAASERQLQRRLDYLRDHQLNLFRMPN